MVQKNVCVCRSGIFHQDFLVFFFLQLTRWRGPGQTWRVRGNIFVAQIRSETPPDMFFILPLLCSATDTPIFCTSGNNHIPSHTDTVRVCWKQSIFSKKKKKKKKKWKRATVEACNATNGRDLIKRNGYILIFFKKKWLSTRLRSLHLLVCGWKDDIVRLIGVRISPKNGQWRLHNCGNTTEATTLLQQFIKKI